MGPDLVFQIMGIIYVFAHLVYMSKEHTYYIIQCF